MKVGNRILNFMIGRYGIDPLNKMILAGALLCTFISMFFGRGVFYACSWILLVIYMFRLLSKNTYKRSQENQRYLYYRYKVTNWFKKIKYRFQDRKIHRYYKCPGCSQTVRVPAGRGRLSISCPKCRTEFIKKT